MVPTNGKFTFISSTGVIPDGVTAAIPADATHFVAANTAAMTNRQGYIYFQQSGNNKYAVVPFGKFLNLELGTTSIGKIAATHANFYSFYKYELS